ncbi:unnamed protein product [[Candida] boidinii]|uniref:Unnamed protein product n=1 Tax=Candida boidinii TaxID=5477 RepID=A0ACB5TN27_CANBO|nr:unnamed protein product [[Candida] boidinii]
MSPLACFPWERLVDSGKASSLGKAAKADTSEYLMLIEVSPRLCGSAEKSTTNVYESKGAEWLPPEQWINGTVDQWSSCHSPASCTPRSQTHERTHLFSRFVVLQTSSWTAQKAYKAYKPNTQHTAPHLVQRPPNPLLSL